MIQSLIRMKFVDRDWGAETLDLLAQFWLRLYQKGDHPAQVPESQQRLRIRLTGFPRSAGVAVSAQLSERFLGSEVEALDADTLLVKINPRPGTDPPAAGLGIPALAGAPFDGLVVEIRFTVADAGATELTPDVMGATLVVVGALHNGTVAVKSLWVDPPFARNLDAWSASPNWDDPLLAAFDHFRSHNKVTRDLACHLFVRPSRNRKENAFAQIGQWLKVPFGRPRLRGVLLRCAIFSVIIILYVSLWALALALDRPVLIAFLIIPGFVWLFPFSMFVRYECEMFSGTYRELHAWYENYFRKTARYASLLPEHPRPWLDDTFIQKATEEVLEAGFVHAGDFAKVPTESAGIMHRAFLAPNGFAILTLSFTYAIQRGAEHWLVWPASVDTRCQTFDSKENRFETFNGEVPLVALKRADPTAQWQLLPQHTHPLELVGAHIKAAELWANETGSTLLPHEPFEEFVARQEELFNGCALKCSPETQFHEPRRKSQSSPR